MDTYDDGYSFGWKLRGAHEELKGEAQRRHLAELNKPLDMAAMNPPEVRAPTPCLVLKPFTLAGGKIAEVGKEVELPRFDALSMQALKRVQILA